MENGIRPPIQMAVDSMRSLRLGNQGEQNAQLIRIDVSKWLEKWSGAGIDLMLALPGEKASYPAKTILQDGELLFLPGFGDTQKAGHGVAYVVATLNGTHVAVSETVLTEILPKGRDGDTLPEAPEAQAGWVANVLNAATRAEEAAKRAENAGGGTITDEQIKAAVDVYLAENPIEVPAYELPTASADTKGGVKVGKGLRMDGDALEAEVQKEDVDKISEEMGSYVKTVNGAAPDENGNVDVEVGSESGGGAWGAENANRVIVTDGNGDQVAAEVDEAFEVSTVVRSGVLATVNLYDETSMAVNGAWYVGSAGAVTFQQNSNTTRYTAIAIPLHNAEEVTLFSYAEYPRIYKWFIADENQKILTQSDNAINRDLHVDALTIPVPEGGDTLYISGRNNWIGVELMVNVGAEASPYAPYNGVSDEPTSTTHFKRKNNVELSLPERYELIVGDAFELFWKGVVKALNPDLYYIEAVCGKGAPYQRRFLFEPTAADVGEHTLTVNVYDQMHILLASGSTKLVVKAKAASPATEKVVLYVSDSLANGGQVPDELHRRLTASDGTPVGDGLSNITFIGSCSSARNSVPYEGYGGWTFASYNTENKSSAYMWITASGHGKTDDDQHSVYKDANDVEWKIETVETGRIKIIRTSSSGNLPATGSLTWVSGGVNTGAIAYTASEQAAGNPFWDDTAGKVDFASYAAEQSKTNIDYVYVLLGWNGMKKSDADVTAEATTFIGNVHASFPNCQVVLLGLQIPARDGLAANYGASETWTYYNAMSHVMRLNRLYEQIAKDAENVSFVQVSGQFDTDYNMPTRERTVNVRSSTKETYQSNGLHPLTAGYYQIADACYRDFVHKLQE